MYSDDFIEGLRSKSPLGRLGFAEVRTVLAFLETAGFAYQAPAGAVAPADPTPADPTPAVLPAGITLAAVESALETAFAAAPIAPPPQ